jgi:hemoglobin/transferrin/lactoferrin receptor protein
MKQLYFLLVLGGLSLHARAQTIDADTTQEAVPLRETVISATRISESRSAVAQQISVIRRADIERLNAQTTADLLTSSGTVFVQKSQQGGGSPVLRGFEASRVLIVVDGVRLNNAIYRAGHLQNVITLDQGALDRTEVLFGPASTVYGSDALGGVVAFYTKNPALATAGEGLRTTGSALARYGTVNNEKTGHVDLSLAGERFGSLTSFTYSDFGDLRMGDNEQNRERFGDRPFYVERIGGVDSLLRNDDPLVQRFSGYRQYDLLQKLVWQPTDRARHALNLQYSTSTDVPRYDRLTDPDDNTGLRFAEWYYGPQERLMAAYTYTLYDAGWFDAINATASWQAIEESRHQRRFGRADRQHRTENVGVGGLTINGQHRWGAQTLQLGVDAQYNDVESTAFAEILDDGTIEAIDTRYPAGGNKMTTAAAYAVHRWGPAEGLGWQFSEGLRAGWTSLRSDFGDRTFFPFPFTSVEQNTPVFSGSLGAIYRPAERWRLSFNAASGFRVPNIDDLAKVFESAPGSLVVPNPDLKPEKTVNVDLNLMYHLSDRLDWETVVWATEMFDALVTSAFQLNGQDSVLYDGELSQVLANQNQRRARLWGFSTELEADLSRLFSAYGNVSYTRGRVLADDALGTDEQPLDHIPPVFGRVGLRFHVPRAGAEAFVLFNGEKPIDQYYPNGEDNEQYAPPGGMPAWWTLNVRGHLRLLGETLTLQAGVDNVLDAQYRVFASGINAPGRNVFVALRAKW